MIDIIPQNLLSILQAYLDENEKIVDAIREVWVPRYDFRWIILTNKRVILLTKQFLVDNLKDFFLKNLDLDLNIGLLYDEIILDVPGKKYRAQFYSFRRKDNITFFKKIQKAAKY